MRVWGVVAVLSCQALTWVCVLSRSARHPKLQKLVELLSDHFQRAKTAGRSTRASFRRRWTVPRQPPQWS